MARTIKAIVPSFTAAANAWQHAQEAYDVVSSEVTGKFYAMVDRTFQEFIDACHIAGVEKDKAGCNALGKEITTNEVVLDMIALGMLQKSTVTNYAQAAKRAFCFNVMFDRNLFKNADLTLPWSTQNNGEATEAKKTAGKSGKVEVTDISALAATLAKAIKQASLLNMTLLHDELLEIAKDYDVDLDVSEEALL